MIQIFEALSKICLTEAFDIGKPCNKMEEIQSVPDRKLLVMSQYTNFKGLQD